MQFLTCQPTPVSWLLILILTASGFVLAEEGKCLAPPESSKYASEPHGFFPTTFHDVPVRSVKQETHDSKVITFGLPEGVSLDIMISSAIMMNAPGVKAGKDVARPYNPISPNTRLGSFDLLIKIYEKGHASKYAGSLRAGDRVSFKQLKGNVKKFRYPFKGKATMTMLAGGTGIAPMYQALQAILHTEGDTTKVHLIYSNKTPQDIMLKSGLDEWAGAYPDRFKVTYVVGDSAVHHEENWDGETGWIDEEKIRRLAYPPAEDTVVWVCGVDAMYDSLAGSRMKPLAEASALHNLGYTDDMVWRS